MRPWTADNFDLSLEYYTRQGGLFSAGVFLKEIKNFFGNAVRVANVSQSVGSRSMIPAMSVGISRPSSMRGTRESLASTSTSGIRCANWAWGAHFTVFANGTYLKLEGDQQAQFSSFIPKSGIGVVVQPGGSLSSRCGITAG